jgi:PPM family protein phosphatase
MSKSDQTGDSRQWMKPETDFAGRQVAGSRESQDDYYGFCPLNADTEGLYGLLLVLADGMGGYAGGSLASRVVVEAFAEDFCFCRGSIPERLLSSLRASERRLLEEIARQDKSLSRMGSTLVGVVWTPGALQWVSVGDSGLYLYRDRILKRLNADHSLAPFLEAQAARGEITPEEAAHHPDRHALLSAIAAEPLEIYDLRDLPFALKPGDIILAATDGLASLTPDVLTTKLELNAGETADRIAAALLTAVNEARKVKQDNATVAIVRNPRSGVASVPEA